MNTWNASMATCTASVEEGSEETVDDSSTSSAAEASTNATVQKRATALPPGINLYGGQVQPQQIPVGPHGQRAARVISYRDLIGAHYRYNRNSNPVLNSTCDARYAPFSAYVSPTLKTRSFEESQNAFFIAMGWKPVVSTMETSSLNGSEVKGQCIPTPTATSAVRSESCVPPKKKLRFTNQHGA